MSGLAQDSETTLALLTRIGDADAEQALERLLRHHRPRLLEYVRLRLDRRLAARLDASDVVQEVQWQVSQRICDFLQRRPMPFHVWLRKTAHERLIDLKRHHLRQRRSLLAEEVSDRSSQALAKALARPSSSPTRRVAEAELARALTRFVAELPEADREILLMRQVERTPFAEIAVVLDIEPAAARKRFGRVLRKLEAALRDQGLLD
jgi:RNA polymerase sigma-70 factor (ECF subfamily)